MWKKAVGFVILLVALLCSFFACASEAPKIPSEDAFSAHIKVTSVTALETGEYRIAVQTTLKNTSENAYILFGNPTCWNELFINGRGECQNLSLSTYTLEGGAVLTEEKTVIISSEERADVQLYAVSSFYLEDKGGEKVSYAIKSNVVNMAEVE